jgi:LysM repeat protein
MSRRIILHRWVLLILALVPILFTPPLNSSAQSETAYDLINAVNALRASQGLSPYQIDSGLMKYAQEHSEYMASIHQGTHQHRDGSLPWEIGLQENVASGMGVSVEVAVNDLWVDEAHRKTMVNFSNGSIGAGIATSDNGQIYYTIDVRPTGNSKTGTAAPTPTRTSLPGTSTSSIPLTTGTVVPGTAIPFIPLVTNTPQQDGAIIHIVRAGETLWKIAYSYGVAVDEIRRLNGIAADSVAIYVNQRLIIRPAHAITPTLPGKSTQGSPPGTISPTSPATLHPTTAMKPEYSPSPIPTVPSTNPSPVSTAVEQSAGNQNILLIVGISAFLAAGLLLYGILTQLRHPK